MEKMQKATHDGEVRIGDVVIPCAVLDNGERVLSQRATQKAIGMHERAGGLRKEDENIGAQRLPRFLTATNLKPFIEKELTARTDPILYKPPHGGRSAYGYTAELLTQVCKVFLAARDAGALTEQQRHIAAQCDLLMRGFAHVGLIALIDEATGYQEVRDRLALQQILDMYLRKEFAAWARRFPKEFYREMFRLKGWQWNGISLNRPSVVGHYTNDLVYARLAPKVLDELRKRNPPDEKGRRKVKHHQWLTEDVGHPALAQHLHAVIGLMRAAANWPQFHRMLERAFPKPGETPMLPFKEEDV